MDEIKDGHHAVEQTFTEPGLGRTVSAGYLFQVLYDTFARQIDQGQHDISFGTEVEVNGALADTGLPGYILDSGFGEPVMPDQLPGHAEDRVSF